MAATTVGQITDVLAQLGGLAILSATLAAVVALVYRWYVRDTVGSGLALLVGLSGVAVVLNTTPALSQVIVGQTEPTQSEVALFNIAAFLVGGGAAAVGRRVGDRFGADVVLGEGADADLGRLVRSVGRAAGVELPAEIDDAVGYDPVPAETKAKLAGETFHFPRGLTDEEVRDRLAARLRADYGVGHVDAEFGADGSVEYLALGSRAAGIGPTLPPATTAVAIRADPAFAASAGDLVQVWETDPMRRVLTAELRGVAGDTATVAIDAADTPKIDPTTEYRLVTLPVDDRPDREFASLLRGAEETVSSVSVEAGSPLHGLPVGALDLAVVAVEPESGTTVALPEPGYVLAPGDVVFAIARPERLRRLETAARPLDPSLVRQVADPSSPEPTADAGETDEARGEPDLDASGTADGSPPRKPESKPDPERSETPPEPGTVTTGGEREAQSATADDGEEDDDVDDTGTTEKQAGDSSFQQLKAEFESGDADWADDADEKADDTDSEATEFTFGDDADDRDDSERGETDEAADLLDDDPLADDELFADDPAGDEDTDDLAALSFEDDEDDGLGLDASDTDDGFGFDDDDEPSDGERAESGDAPESRADDDEESADDEDEKDEDDQEESEDEDEEDSGGGGSFQQLKEEFESGDADWADDVSDSPGGDMRLDE
jgi:hypothetical protein